MSENTPGSEMKEPESTGPDEPTETESTALKETNSVSDNVKSSTIWMRLFFMVVLGFLWGISRVVIGAVVVIQFFWVLFNGEVHEELKRFGGQLATYSYQVINYLTFNTEERPFPFDLKWPNE